MAKPDRYTTNGQIYWEWGWAAITMRRTLQGSAHTILFPCSKHDESTRKKTYQDTLPNPDQVIRRIDEEVASGHAEEVLRQARALRVMGNEDRCTELLEAFMEKLAGESSDVH